MRRYDVVCLGPVPHETRNVWALARPTSCPTCDAATETLWTKERLDVSAVTWPGGKVFENLGHEPIRFDSPADLNRYLKAHRIEPFVRHTTLPGTDKSPHTTSWSSMSAVSLDGARALLERVGQTSKGADAPAPSYVQSMRVDVSVEHR